MENVMRAAYLELVKQFGDGVILLRYRHETFAPGDRHFGEHVAPGTTARHMVGVCHGISRQHHHLAQLPLRDASSYAAGSAPLARLPHTPTQVRFALR